MRLLDVNSKEFKEFTYGEIPPFAILSHTWGDQEVTFQDFQKACSDVSSWQENKGFKKILRFCEKAKGKFKWVWVDTCCIDKTSSAELSEAINSMFRWYKRSDLCYTYLADIEANTATDSDHLHIGKTSNVIQKSRWFTRGWTLQELLAPEKLHFYDKDWNFIGKRQDFFEEILAATGIPPPFLSGVPLRDASIAQRMSWASKRTTKRQEDIAYCLLGMFDINMPLLYGEGDKAFRRLQREIVKFTDDQSLFAWGFSPTISGSYPHDDRNINPFHGEFGLFACSPRDFQDCGDIVQCDAWESKDNATVAELKITKSGFFIELPVITNHFCAALHPGYICGWEQVGILNCRSARDSSKLLALPLVQDFETAGRSSFNRYRNVPLKPCPDVVRRYTAWDRNIYTRVYSHGPRLVQRSLIIRHKPLTDNRRHSFALSNPYFAMISGPTVLRGWRREVLNVDKSLRVTEGGKLAATRIPASTHFPEMEHDECDPKMEQAVYIYYSADSPESPKTIEFVLRIVFRPSRLFRLAKLIGAPPLFARSLKGSMTCHLANGSAASDLAKLTWLSSVTSGTRTISLINRGSSTGHNIWALNLIATGRNKSFRWYPERDNLVVYFWIYIPGFFFLWLANRSGTLFSLHLFNETVLYTSAAALFGYSLSLMSRKENISDSIMWFCTYHLLIAFVFHSWS